MVSVVKGFGEGRGDFGGEGFGEIRGESVSNVCKGLEGFDGIAVEGFEVNDKVVVVAGGFRVVFAGFGVVFAGFEFVCEGFDFGFAGFEVGFVVVVEIADKGKDESGFGEGRGDDFGFKGFEVGGAGGGDFGGEGFEGFYEVTSVGKDFEVFDEVLVEDFGVGDEIGFEGFEIVFVVIAERGGEGKKEGAFGEGDDGGGGGGDFAEGRGGDFGSKGFGEVRFNFVSKGFEDFYEIAAVGKGFEVFDKAVVEGFGVVGKFDFEVFDCGGEVAFDCGGEVTFDCGGEGPGDGEGRDVS